MRTDWLIVGAGLSGVTFAERIASQRGEKVVIIDQRDHVGGNVYDEYNEHGILTHKYGPHIFHTNDQEVFEYLSQFTSWRPYQHKVLGLVEGQLIPLPFNLNSIDALFSRTMSTRLSDKLVAAYGHGANVPILQLRESGDVDLRFLANFVYQNVFENYTKKQWGMTPEELSPSVTARVPIRVSRGNRYFQDKYQAIPSEGYTVMIRRMLSHPNIRIMLKDSWKDVANDIKHKKILFTGQIDEFFQFIHGVLPYRSLNFDMQTHNCYKYQSAPVINYPNDYEYTRVTEWKLLTGQIHSQTASCREYSAVHVYGSTIPYYPIPRDENIKILEKYKLEAKKMTPSTFIAGRLGMYKYLNMDEVVKNSLNIIKNGI